MGHTGPSAAASAAEIIADQFKPSDTERLRIDLRSQEDLERRSEELAKEMEERVSKQLGGPMEPERSLFTGLLSRFLVEAAKDRGLLKPQNVWKALKDRERRAFSARCRQACKARKGQQMQLKNFRDLEVLVR